MKAQAEAEAYKMQAFAEAAEMQAKGYTYQQETARQVGLEAMQNGITGGGSGGGGSLGDLAGLGVTLGAMGGVINMTKEAMNPIMGQSADIGAGFGAVVAGQTANAQGGVPGAQGGVPNGGVVAGGGAGQVVSTLQTGSWICPSCGTKDITSKFCPECGAAKPIPVVADSWTCPGCGMKGISSKFCPECGTKRPDAVQNVAPDTWTCPSCGTKDINGKFCPECGRKRDM